MLFLYHINKHDNVCFLNHSLAQVMSVILSLTSFMIKTKEKHQLRLYFLIICTKRTILLLSLIKFDTKVTILRLNDGLILNTFQKAAA